MPQIPCPDKIDCACDDSPLANLSSEAPDLPVFISTSYTGLTPPLGSVWSATACHRTCVSTVSQEAADLCAAQAAAECVISGWTSPGGPPNAPVPPASGGGGGPRYLPFLNAEQTCGVRCADGLVFRFTVPAFVFAGTSQARADAQARSYACRQAQLRKLCLSSLTSPVCAGVEFNQSITASGKFLATGSQTNAWVLEAGTLPPGLTFNGGNLKSNSAAITGTPTTPGSYFFIISVTDPKGDAMAKGYTLVIAGITNAHSLPEGTIGAPYAAQLNTVGFTSPTFTLDSGTLPSGLTLNSSGTITGTPTVGGDSTFSVKITDGVTGFHCVQGMSATVAAGCSPVPGLAGLISEPNYASNNLQAIAFRDTGVPLIALGRFDSKIIFKALDGSIPDVSVSLPGTFIAQAGVYCPTNNRFYFITDDLVGPAGVAVVKIDPDTPAIESTVALSSLQHGARQGIFIPARSVGADDTIVFNGDHRVTVYNATTDTVIAAINPPVIPGHNESAFQGQCTHVVSTDEIWISARAPNGATFMNEAFLYIYDAQTLAFKNSVALPQGPDDTNGGTCVYCPTNDRLYVLNNRRFDDFHLHCFNPHTFLMEADFALTAPNFADTFAVYDAHTNLVLISMADQTVLAICPALNQLQGYTAMLPDMAWGAAYSAWAQASYFGVPFNGAEKLA